jgi:biopolymer transport protein ExbD
MPKIKVPRKSTAIDMTAMCDVAFLLLTFFILTSQFRPQELVVVDTPTSISDIKQPKNLFLITVGKDGKVYVGISGQQDKEKVLRSFAKSRKVEFTNEEYYRFSLLDNFGVPLSGLKQWLNASSDVQNKMIKSGELPGIPVDSLNNELGEWLYHAMTTKSYFIAVKGDRDANYEAVQKVLNVLQERDQLRFLMVTGMEAKPEI